VILHLNKLYNFILEDKQERISDKEDKKKVSLTLNYRKKRVNRKYKEHTLHAQTKKGSSLKDKKKRLSKLLEEKLLEEVSSSSSGEDENLNELLNNDKKKARKRTQIHQLIFRH